MTWASLKVSQQPVVIGFDLDMTLLDTRRGIAATWRALTERTGVHVDADLAASRLGPPLRQEMSEWFPFERIEEAIGIYRSLYPDHAIAPSVALPGAEQALDAVRQVPARIAVITSKLGRLAELHLAYLGISVDKVYGDAFHAGKARVLQDIGAALYVGDHVADMQAAALAGIPAVGVTSGPCSAEDLHAAGATVVFEDLRPFPAFLKGVISVGRAVSGD
ncbi:HAD family hydrolase [Dactylosporangium sp. NPDC000555]|uniref:HAD family hydrolase n=1 Tax=Dactylosporangium sp. NPDC000555 TaxID=3154260 RepID=UPI003317BAE8